MRHPPLAAAGPTVAIAPRTGGHLAAVDVVRFLTVGAVILVHATSVVTDDGSQVGNGVEVVAHVTRSVFIGLSALVLTYSFSRRPMTRASFWRRRYPLVVVPYVVWSAVYVLAGGHLGSPLHVTGEFLHDLVDGRAHYHLYFLLLTFQLYLIFPPLMAALRRWPGILRPALIVAGVFQVAFDAAVHYNWRPAVLGVWFDHPGSWLPSYTLYIVAGVAIAQNLEAVGTWIDAHRRQIGWAFLGAVAVALCSYGFDQAVLGYSSLKAAEVFQPADVVVAVAALLGEFALGMWFTRRAGDQWLSRLRTSTDASFGVYLAHPLILSAILSLAGAWGLSESWSSWSEAAVELMVAFVLVPVVYALSFVLIRLARRSPASLALSGRRVRAGARRDEIVRTVAVLSAVSMFAVLISACGVQPGTSAPASASHLSRAAAPASAPSSTSSSSSSTSSSTTSTTIAAPPASSLVAVTKSPVTWAGERVTLTYQGIQRSYYEFRPITVQATKIPVLVELAGCCFPIEGEVVRADFQGIAGPAILIYPVDIGQHWNAGACCGKQDDAGFVAAVLTEVRAQNPDASPSLAYLAGYSNGAKLATMIACGQPGLFTAVAVYAATRGSDCAKPAAESMLFLAGSVDPEAPLSGPPFVWFGYTEPTIDQISSDYRRADRCGPATQKATAGVVTVTVWYACSGSRQVGIATWKGQDHHWPQTTANGPSIQQVMWDWFAQFH